jgi:BON domain
MNNRWLNKVRLQALAATAALVISGAVLFAQDAPPAGGSRTDGQIEMDVVHALDASAALKNDLITAATISGEVILSGTVASDADRQLAESIASKVPGVTKVDNRLKVGNPSDDPNNVPPEDNSAPIAEGQGNQNPPSYSPSPDQAPNQEPNQAPNQGQAPQPPSYPSDQQSQNYPQQQPQVQMPPPGTGRTPGQYGPPQGPGYASPGGPGPYYPAPPQQPGYAQPYGRGGYALANSPITVPSGTVISLRTNASLDEKHAVNGQPVDFVVIQDVLVRGYLAIPRGAVAHGVVTQSKHAGQLTGSPELALALTALDIDGHIYPLQSDEFRVKGPSKTGRTVGNAVGGALMGALIGGAVGGGGGAAVGAVAGGGAGTALSVPGGPHAWIPAEALVTFHLNEPVTVDPVSQEQARRLAQGLYPGGPELYRRRAYYGPGYPPPPPGYYAYPPVYYHPYYYSGGYYYWR